MTSWPTGSPRAPGWPATRSSSPPSRPGTPATPARRSSGSRRALSDPERRDLVRRVMVAIFTELGPDDPLAREHRRRLSAALN